MNAFHKPLVLALLSLGCAAPAGGGEEVPEEARQSITSASRAGERIELEGVDFGAIPTLDVTIDDGDDSPQFLLSDKPEYFRTGDGIAMQETIDPGLVRFYLYHVPTPDAGAKKITAVIENLGDEEMTVAFEKAVVPEAGKDYHKMGKAGLVGFFSPSPDLAGRTLRVAPGDTKLLDPRLHAFDLETDDLVHGFYQFNIDQPARISTLQTSPGVDPAVAVHALEKLPQVLEGWHPSGAGRGLFTANSNKTVQTNSTWDTADGSAQMIFADGDDDWITGIDSISGEDAVNKGNYGVIYEMEIPYTSSDGRGVALLVYNARAGAQWCGQQALAVQLETQGKLETPEHGVVELPADQVPYAGPPEAVVVQVFPSVEQGETGWIRMRYSPPGASCLPVPFVLVPVEVSSPVGG